MRSVKDPRHIARLLAVMDLFAYFFHYGDNSQSLQSNFDVDQLELGNYSKKLRNRLVEGIKQNYPVIDSFINQHSDLIRDIEGVLLQIIRIGAFEAFLDKSVPPKVAIDEAIELAKDFGLENQAKKVAGILGKIYSKVLGDGKS